jgi:hypothetical protein
MRWLSLLGPSVRAVIWFIMLAWTGLALLSWMTVKVDNVMQQNAVAAQTAAGLIAGYIIARACTFIVKEAESVIEPLIQKNKEVPKPPPSPADGRDSARGVPARS